MRRWMGLALAVGVVVVGAACVPVGPRRPPQPTDCTNWRYGAADEPAPGTLPTELDRDSYKSRSRARPATRRCSTRRTTSAARRARPLDLALGCHPGSRRRRASRCSTRASSGATPARWPTSPRKAYINLGEARPPCCRPSPTATATATARFDITDFGAIPDLNGNGVADPEDLILDPRVQQRRRRRPQRLRRRHLGLGLPLRRQRPARHRRATATAPARPRTRPRPRTAPATSARARSAGSCPSASATRSSPTAAASRPACCSRSTRAPT